MRSNHREWQYYRLPGYNNNNNNNAEETQCTREHTTLAIIDFRRHFIPTFKRCSLETTYIVGINTFRDIVYRCKTSVGIMLI